MVAQELKSAGFKVYAAARRVDRMADLEKDSITPVALDLTRDGSIAACVNTILSREKSIDVLVNNAGITRDTLVLRMKDEDFDPVIDTNLRGAFLFLREAAKIDGANEWHIFWNICLPQCRSALYSIAILVFIDNWNMVKQPLILLNDVEKQPLSMFLSSINAGEIGIAFAAAVIYMIPGLLLFLHGEAYLVEGIAHSGSVKG